MNANCEIMFIDTMMMPVITAHIDSLNNANPTRIRTMPMIRWIQPHWVRSNVTRRFGPAITNWSSAIATRPWIALNAPEMTIIVPAKTIQPYQPPDVPVSVLRWDCAMSVLLGVNGLGLVTHNISVTAKTSPVRGDG